jgi:hypothetical protein
MNKKQPKYLLLCEVFYPEEFLINDLIKQWEKDGLAFEVLTRVPSYPFGKVFKGYKNKIYQKEKWGNILIHRFPVIPGYQRSKIIKTLNFFSFIFFGTIIALFIGKRYEKIFIYHTGPLSLAIPGIIIKKIFKKPVAIWSFDLWPKGLYAWGVKKTKVLDWGLNHLVRWVYKNCETIFVSSRGFIPELKKYVPEKEILYAPNWPQVSAIANIKSSVSLGSDKTHFTFTGNVGGVQNLENVILGFNESGLSNAQLNIFGDGSLLSYLKTFTKEKGIENVKFWGRVPVNEIMDIMEQSSILVISLVPNEIVEMTLPLKFQTYLTAKKPIYAIMLGEVKKIVEEFNLGKTAHPLNIVDIAEGFRSFNITEEWQQIITKNTEYLLHDFFNREKIIQDITRTFINKI